MPAYPRLRHLVAAFLLGVLLIHIGQDRFIPYDADPSPELFGSSFAVSIGLLLSAGAVVAYLMMWLARRGFGRFTLGLFVLWALVSLHYIHISNNHVYTNDISGHIARAQFIATNWFTPYAYLGSQAHHPPLYYYLAGLAVSVADWLQSMPMLTALRFVSWVSYGIFACYSLMTLRLAGLPRGSYNIAATLLLLWPASFHLSSKINPELLYYAVYAAAFYYTLRWYQAGRRRDLMTALLVAGAALTVRTNAVILFAIIGLLVLVAFARGRIDVKNEPSQQWARVALVLVACVFINVAHVIFGDFGIVSHMAIVKLTPEPFTVGDYLSYNYSYMLKVPYNDYTRNEGFWDYLLKTSMFGEYTWPSPGFGVALNVLLILVILYALLPWLWASRAEWRGMLPHAVGLAVPLAFLIVFAVWTNNFPSMDARYVYPALVSFIIFFGKSHAMHVRRGALALSWLGPLLVALFTITAIVFFSTNFR